MPFPFTSSGVLAIAADTADPMDVNRRVCGGLAAEGPKVGLPGNDDAVVDGVGGGCSILFASFNKNSTHRWENDCDAISAQPHSN